jgi:hypothetical protein
MKASENLKTMLCKCRRDLGHHLDHHYLLPPHSSYYVQLNSPFYGYGYDVNNIGNYEFFYYYFGNLEEISKVIDERRCPFKGSL